MNNLTSRLHDCLVGRVIVFKVSKHPFETLSVSSPKDGPCVSFKSSKDRHVEDKGDVSYRGNVR